MMTEAAASASLAASDGLAGATIAQASINI